MFVHLNTHSNYSAMMGTVTIDQLLIRARQYKQSAMALTEVNSLRSFIHFIQKAKEANILPIAGTNIITDNFDLILLAENQKGYENSCHIISDVKADREITLKKLLKKQNDGVFILAHQRTALAELRKYISATHLFVELRCGMSETDARAMAREFGLEMVATGDVYFR